MHAAVAELDERVHDALRVHHHLERVVRQAEQVVRLDHLERLVRERRAVHGDLPAHLPGRMTQRLVDRGLAHPLRGPLAEGPARAVRMSRAQSGVPPGEALEHGAVLGVHRHDLAAAGARGLSTRSPAMTSVSLLASATRFPRPERRERGVEPGRPDDRVHHDVHVGMRRRLQQHVGSARIAACRRRPSRAPAKAGAPLAHLLVEALDVLPRRQRHDAKVLRAGAAAPPACSGRSSRSSPGRPRRARSSGALTG